MNKTAVNILLNDLKSAHKHMMETMHEVTNEVASYKPKGTANPIAGVYAHLLFSEDFFVQFFLKKGKPLFETDWKDKTGASELQPTDWQNEFPKWIKRVTIDVKKSHAYTHAVFATTEEFLNTLSDEDLEKSVDMSPFGMGDMPTGDFISQMIIAHTWSIMGEIAVLKGIQGLKGYPF